MRLGILLGAALVLVGSPASAQIPAPPGPITAPPAAQAAAPAGTVIEIEIVNALSSSTAKRGDYFPIRLCQPIVEGDKILVRAGATGEGQVVDAAPSGALGKPAKMVLAARYLEIDGHQVRLKAMRLGGAGADKTSQILAENLIPYVGILFDFQHGGEFEIPAGTRALAKLAEDLSSSPPPSSSAGQPPAVKSDIQEAHP
jgi:hypothetical protein